MVFERGADLSRAFHDEVLAPVLGGLGTPWSAGLLGPGSDVLGYDTARSTDHDWGPRATVWVSEDEVTAVRDAVVAALPVTYRGHPVRTAGDTGVPLVEVTSRTTWLTAYLGVDPLTDPLTWVDWLCLPQQRLLGVTAGPVFHDGGDLTAVRDVLARFPDDVWWWVLASQWRRIAQEEPLPQRTAEVGDDLGSALVTGHLVRDVVRLALLVDRRYWPWGKWLGTAFARMPQWDSLSEHLTGAVRADSVDEADHHLLHALETVARRFNTLTPDGDVDPRPRPFHDRPAMVLGADRFAEAALARVTDPDLRALPLLGSLDQWADSTDLLVDPVRCRAARALYHPGADGEGPRLGA